MMFSYFLSIDAIDIILGLIVILFFFCIFMFKQNRILRSHIKRLREENEYLNNLLNNSNNNLSNNSSSNNNSLVNEELDNGLDSVDIDNSLENKKLYYTKNVLQGKKRVTSPISIDNGDSFNVNDFVKKENVVIENDAYDYLKEVSDKLASEVEAKAIELTEYEKRQEESAIISYKELLKVKDQIETYDDEDGDVDFLEELKSFRDNLK